MDKRLSFLAFSEIGGHAGASLILLQGYLFGIEVAPTTGLRHAESETD
jgi:hypothetical protein